MQAIEYAAADHLSRQYQNKGGPSSETAGLRPRICGTHQQAVAVASSTTRQP